MVSDLHLSLAKSSLIAVGDVANLDQLAADLGCRMGSLPATYLGMPLGSSFKEKDVYGPVIDRMRGWQGGKLNTCLEGVVSP